MNSYRTESMTENYNREEMTTQDSGVAESGKAESSGKEVFRERVLLA